MEKTIKKQNSKFVYYQHQSVSNLAKLKCKKELIEIKEKQKKYADMKKRKENACDKEHQKQKLHDAINMHHHDYMTFPGRRNNNKKIQESVIINF